MFETYDEEMASALAAGHEKARGLPGYLGIRLSSTWPGGLRATVEVRPELLTPFGNLHGGVIAAVVDHVLGTVCYPVIPRGAWAATTEFKLNYLAPVTGGTLEAKATVLSLTKRTAVVRIEVQNEGRLACLAQGTVLVMPPRPRQGGAPAGSGGGGAGDAGTGHAPAEPGAPPGRSEDQASNS